LNKHLLGLMTADYPAALAEKLREGEFALPAT
jgi:hypothetical protein